MEANEFLKQFVKAVKTDLEIDLETVLNLVKKMKMEPALESINLPDQSFETTMHHTLEAYRDTTFCEKVPDRIDWCLNLASVARKKGDYDQAIQLLREGLTIPSNKAHCVLLYKLLFSVYKDQGNWIDAIECCQAIISMAQLPSNSPFIVEAYMNCGMGCERLGNYSEALVNYLKALELQEQHHIPRHPVTGKVHVKLGSIFSTLGNADAAFAHFHSAITLDYPESSNEAHERIARIYMRRAQYDEALRHLLQCLGIRKHHFPSKTIPLVKTYLLLMEIEHITGHHQQRDLYLQQASCLADSSDKARDLLSKGAERILSIASCADP